MAKRKKIDISDLKSTNTNTPTRYYWCVNCGHHGDFGYLRIRGLNCENCGYDMIADYTTEEIEDSKDLTFDRFKKLK